MENTQMENTQIGDTDVATLPDWARKTIRESNLVRKAAYLYRRHYGALKTALHETLKGNASDLDLYDRIIRLADRISEKQESFDNAEDRAMSKALRKRMVAEYRQWVRAGFDKICARREICRNASAVKKNKTKKENAK